MGSWKSKDGKGPYDGWQGLRPAGVSRGESDTCRGVSRTELTVMHDAWRAGRIGDDMVRAALPLCWVTFGSTLEAPETLAMWWTFVIPADYRAACERQAAGWVRYLTWRRSDLDHGARQDARKGRVAPGRHRKWHSAAASRPALSLKEAEWPCRPWRSPAILHQGDRRDGRSRFRPPWIR
jgi:hypothetical protein